MSTSSPVIKINAITVPAGGGAELARRFAARAGAVDGQPGFLGFELLTPTDGRATWLVVTRWSDEASFDAWVASPAFAAGHRGESEGHGSGHGAGHGAGHGRPGTGHGDDSAGHSSTPGGDDVPVAMQAELWSFEIATASTQPSGDA